MADNKTVASKTDLALAPNWSAVATLPALGNLDSYISAVNRMPMLTPEHVHDFSN